MNDVASRVKKIEEKAIARIKQGKKPNYVRSFLRNKFINTGILNKDNSSKISPDPIP
jgi:hypothetical protein